VTHFGPLRPFFMVLSAGSASAAISAVVVAVGGCSGRVGLLCVGAGAVGAGEFDFALERVWGISASRWDESNEWRLKSIDNQQTSCVGHVILHNRLNKGIV
jgi:hypothetical protein